MTDLVVRGGRALIDGALRSTDLASIDGVLAPASAVGPDPAVLDAGGLLVAPGYVDLQCNGGLGIDLASEPERLWELGAALPRYGVTAWLPTIVTTPEGVVDRALTALAEGPPDRWRGAVPLGLHLEGPVPVAREAGCASRRAPATADAGRDRGLARVTEASRSSPCPLTFLAPWR